jgi:hypothetical protein
MLTFLKHLFYNNKKKEEKFSIQNLLPRDIVNIILDYVQGDTTYWKNCFRPCLRLISCPKDIFDAALENAQKTNIYASHSDCKSVHIALRYGNDMKNSITHEYFKICLCFSNLQDLSIVRNLLLTKVLNAKKRNFNFKNIQRVSEDFFFHVLENGSLCKGWYGNEIRLDYNSPQCYWYCEMI